MRLGSAIVLAIAVATLAGCTGQGGERVITLDLGTDLPRNSGTTLALDSSRPDRPLCFEKIYVPARYRITTRGRLLRAADEKFEVVNGNGDVHWNHVREPAVYLERRKLIEPDHYSLHLVECAPSDGIQPVQLTAIWTPPTRPDGQPAATSERWIASVSDDGRR